MGEFPDDLHDETGPLLLQSKDIQPGDIILWKGNPAEFLDLLIMSLTESDCSHATIVYDTNLDPDHPDYHGYDTMVCEETSYGVHASMTVDKKDWRIGYVRRPKCLMGDNALPFQPVKELCAKYVRQNNKYNTADFAALTVLLLLKNYTPEIDLQLDIITLLEMAAHFLNSTFFAIAEPKKAAEGGLLTCSSFVYHVYEEASEKEPGYKLKVVDGVCANMKRDVIPSPLEQPIKFIDYLISDLSHDASLAGDLARVVFELGEHIINLAEDKIEDVFHSIYDWVTHHIIKGDSGEPTNQERLAATVDADNRTKNPSVYGPVLVIAANLYKSQHPEMTSDDIKAMVENDPAELLRWLRDDYDYGWMVTPTDLKVHCPDLVDVGYVRFKHGDTKYDLSSKPYVPVGEEKKAPKEKGCCTAM